MSAPTPGQAAWEAFAAKRRADLGDEFYTPANWGDDYDDARKWEAAWEAAAAAGETEQVRLARQDRDQLRKHVLDLAADLDISAAATRPSRKSSIESEIAIALRKAAEPPS